MSNENVALLRKGYEAWNRGDYEAVLALLDPEVEWQFPEGGLNTGTLHGREAVGKFFESFGEAFEELRFEPEEIFESDDRVVAIVRLVARGRGSGVELEVRPAHIWTMRRGRAVRLEVVPETDRKRESRATAQADNVGLLRAFLDVMDLEAWSRGEGDMSILDPKVAYEDSTLPDHVGEIYRGRQGVARATERWLEPYEELTIELEQVVGAGDRLVSIHRVRGKARYTGIEAEGPVAYIWTFRDGKVVHFRSYRDPDEALEAAGLGSAE
jgi:uncharacterized protein